MATTSITPPWNIWALDKPFLADLDKWIKANPETKLGTVLDKVCDGIESGKDLISLIPDSPFPARSLIQGLGGLVKLGNAIRKAKSAALKFAKRIVGWIEDLLKAFREGNMEQFTMKTWHNLDSVRVLVDEICQWAKARLEDRWWSRNTHKFTVESEIQEFQSQLDDATGRFMQLSMINLSTAQDLLAKGNVLVLEEIEKAHVEIKKAREEIDEVLGEIKGLSADVREKRLQEQYLVDLAFIQKELAPYIASNSAYREQGKEFCYPGTRLEPLTVIKNWVSDFSKEAPHFLWLTGEPGSGKSTIAATVCRDLKDSNCLWAELFINRNYLNTTNSKFFFPSIAVQLAKRSPEVAHVISCALQEKPSLVDEVSETLADELFVKPLSSASQANPLKAIVVLVDALDEYDAENLPILAKLLSNMTSHLAENVKVLISSREEDVIRASWAAAPDTRHLSVGTINRSSIEDVASFLKGQIRKIVHENELDAWPGEENMQKLCLQASGLFIWATTAIKYIRSQILTFGSECLDDVLDQLNMKGMGDINLLYGTILEKMYSGESDPWAFETFRRVVGSIVVLNTPFSLGTLERILDLRRMDKHRPVDVTHFVRRFRTVLVIGTDKITRETIPRLHKSFFEFVTSTNIRPDLRVSSLLSHKELAPKCLAHSSNVGDIYFHAARSSYQWIVDQLPDNDPEIPAHLICFVDLECSNYQHCGEVTSLDTSISAAKRLIQITSDQHHDKPQYFSKLCTLYRFRYQRLGDLQDLDSSLQIMSAAVELTPPGHPDQPGYLCSLAVSIRDRYKRLGDVSDLQRALAIIQEAVTLTPEWHLNFPGQLQNLAEFFRDRYKRLGDPGDLETALQAIQKALDLTPTGHPDKPGYLRSLAISTRDRYQTFGHVQDLEAALKFIHEAVALTPEQHAELPCHLQCLADLCADKYRRLGDLMELEISIQTIRQAVDLTPESHPDLPGRFRTLAASLRDRYQRLGDWEDLNSALQLLRQAVDLTPKDHPDLPGYLRSLAVSIGDRYQRTQDLQSLEQTRNIAEEAVALTPDGHPDRPEYLQTLALSIRVQYAAQGELQDLERALFILQEEIHLTPQGHPNLPQYLQSLAEVFRDRYKKFGDLTDLEAAMESIRKAVSLTPEGHLNKSSYLQSLVRFHEDKSQISGDFQDLEAAFSILQHSFTMCSACPVMAWEAAMACAVLAKEHKPSDLLPAYFAAFDLLPEILWIGNSSEACQDARKRIKLAQATSDVIKVCLDLSHPQLAVEFLEKGLTTTFEQLQQLKTNCDALPEAFAGRFQQLSWKIYAGVSDIKSLAMKRNSLLTEIHKLAGFESFLCPKPYSDLCRASQNGPVVILNSHKDHCDAIVLLNPVSDPLRILLPDGVFEWLENQRSALDHGLRYDVRLGISREEDETQSSLEGVLTWLWENVVIYVYQALESHDISNGRLWWLPTGAFKGLPLHAAAKSDQFIQSYTSSLESLLAASSERSCNPPLRLGVVGTLGNQEALASFPGVVQEANTIMAIVGKENAQYLIRDQGTVEAMKLQLRECSWIHIAGHGKQDRIEPLKSFIQLYGGHLELETIVRMDLPNADFAFLAICETFARTADEADMVGGFIVAGFRGVIGTMWTMQDKDGPPLADTFYTHLFANGRKPQASDAAKALQLSVRKMRDAGLPPKNWVPFIHVGI
ncbi:CHAT domain-containing protein [Mycena rosella]|uniref:CHAT domain-containing protein n=1 Tax=Mycena rosella TaxID=1033263 RepID=A0AAD7BV75_MYCRO|nr:CHAT domain-containing protein [Mycena rosella]